MRFVSLTKVSTILGTTIAGLGFGSAADNVVRFNQDRPFTVSLGGLLVGLGVAIVLTGRLNAIRTGGGWAGAMRIALVVLGSLLAGWALGGGLDNLFREGRGEDYSFAFAAAVSGFGCGLAAIGWNGPRSNTEGTPLSPATSIATIHPEKLLGGQPASGVEKYPADHVTLRWLRDDGDGFGKLTVISATNGFAGRSSAWFDSKTLTDFGDGLNAFPLSDEEKAVSSGFGAKGAAPPQEHVAIQVGRVGSRGQVGLRVHFSTEVWPDTRQEAEHDVHLELLTTYERLRAFGNDLVGLVAGDIDEARIEGETLV